MNVLMRSNEERRAVAKLKLEAAMHRQEAARLQREARRRSRERMLALAESAMWALGACAALSFGIMIAVTPTHYQEPATPTPPWTPPVTTPPNYTMTPALTPALTPPPPAPDADETQCLPEYLPNSCVPLQGPIPGTIGWGERLV
jgi:hypothetical protein